MKPRAKRGRRPRRHREQGAVAVETALVSLVLVAILFGIIEASFLFRDANVISSASRAGARLAASEPVASSFAADAAKQSVNAMSGIEKSAVTNIWVYKAQADGTPAGGATCSSSCIKFTVSAAGVLSSGSGSWSGRQACAGSSLDRVGVRVAFKHKAAMGFMFDGKMLTESTIMQLEPIPATSPCVSS